MTYFMKSGTRFNVSTKEAMDLHEHLPAGNYTVKFDKMAGCFYLEQIESFEIRGKIYGDTRKQSQRILNTFNDRTASTGVMLTGEKGSGKTLLAKLLAVTAAEAGVPTIVINEPWCGEGFNAFMQMIGQPTRFADINVVQKISVHVADRNALIAKIKDSTRPVQACFPIVYSTLQQGD
jgi:hypothetical protein